MTSILVPELELEDDLDPGIIISLPSDDIEELKRNGLVESETVGIEQGTESKVSIITVNDEARERILLELLRTHGRLTIVAPR